MALVTDQKKLGMVLGKISALEKRIKILEQFAEASKEMNKEPEKLTLNEMLGLYAEKMKDVH